MEVFGFLLLLFLGWAAYRIFISGAGDRKSFLQYYRDQNKLRKWVQDQGGIHKVEEETISLLEENGFEAEEYAENGVSLRKEGEVGYLEVKVMYDQKKKRHVKVGYSPNSSVASPDSLDDILVDESKTISEEINRAIQRHFSTGSASMYARRLQNDPADYFGVRETRSANQKTASKKTERRSEQENQGNSSGDPESSSQKSTYGEATITVSEFVDQFFVLPESAIERLRNGESLVLNGVKFKDSYPVPGNPSIKNSLMFNVAALSDVENLQEYSFEEDGEQAVLWDDVTDQDMINPTFTNWSDNPVASSDEPLMGQFCDVTIELVELEGGREILDVVDFRPQYTRDADEGLQVDSEHSGKQEAERRSRIKSYVQDDENEPMTVSEFEDRFFVLTESATERLRDGKSVFVEDVEWQAMTQKVVSFSVATAGAVRDLQDVCFKKDGEHVIPFGKVAEHDLVRAEYSLERPLSGGEKPIELMDGECDIKLAMEDLGYGREKLKVTDCRVSSLQR
jgi:hypothetical protein